MYGGRKVWLLRANLNFLCRRTKFKGPSGGPSDLALRADLLTESRLDVAPLRAEAVPGHTRSLDEAVESRHVEAAIVEPDDIEPTVEEIAFGPLAEGLGKGLPVLGQPGQGTEAVMTVDDVGRQDSVGLTRVDFLAVVSRNQRSEDFMSRRTSFPSCLAWVKPRASRELRQVERLGLDHSGQDPPAGPGWECRFRQ